MIQQARRSPTGWLLVLVGFSGAGAAAGWLVSWSAAWPAAASVVVGAVIGLLLAGRALTRPGPPSGVTSTVDLSTFRTNRIRLRHLTDEDAREGSVMTTVDEEVVRSMGWSPAEVAAVASVASDAARMNSQGYLAISPADDDEILGIVSLTTPSETPGEAWLGLWLAPPARGHGVAAEAIGVVADVVWSAGLHSIAMGTSAGNHAMQRSYTDAGAQLFDTVAHTLPNGEVVESLWYRIEGPPTAAHPPPA